MNIESGPDPDVAAAERARDSLTTVVAGMQKVVDKLTGIKEFNVNSSPQIRDYFQPEQQADGNWCTHEGIILPKTKTGGASLDANVMFLGYRDDVPDLIKAADLFVMPSYMEGLCTSLLDAMFAGVPIVTTGAGGIADVVAATDPNGPYAFLAPARDDRALAEAILTALSNPKQSARIAASAERRAQTLFGHDQMVDGTLDVYREWLARDQSYAA